MPGEDRTAKLGQVVKTSKLVVNVNAWDRKKRQVCERTIGSTATRNIDQKRNDQKQSGDQGSE